MNQYESIRIIISRYDNNIDEEDILKGFVWLTPVDSSVYLSQHLDMSVLDPQDEGGGAGGGPNVSDLLITFLKDDAVIIALITAITKVLTKVIEMSKDSEITIEIGDRKLTLIGAVKKKDEMIATLFPELSTKDIKPAPSKLADFDPYVKLKIRTKNEIEFEIDDDTSFE